MMVLKIGTAWTETVLSLRMPVPKAPLARQLGFRRVALPITALR